MKKQATLLALVFALSTVAVPAYAAGDDTPEPGMQVIQWITDGLDALWQAIVEDTPPAAPAPSNDEAGGDNGPDDGNDEFGPELVPIG